MKVSRIHVKGKSLSSLLSCVCQRLLEAWPPVTLLSDLEDWLKNLETRLSTEKEAALEAKNDAQITKILQNYKVLIHPLSTLSFFCESLSREVLFAYLFLNASALF